MKKKTTKRKKSASNASLGKIAARALESVAEDFAEASRPNDGRISTGAAIGGMANIVTNKAHSAVTIFDKLTSFKTYVAGWIYVEKTIIPLMKKKIEAIPEQDRQEPKLLIAGPIFDAAKFTENDPPLAEMFAELLAGAMDKKRAHLAHPSYVDVIKNLTSSEARLIKFMGDTDEDCAVIDVQEKKQSGEYRDIVRNFSYLGKKAGMSVEPAIMRQISSLCRLGLTEIPADSILADESKYVELETAPELEKIRNEITEAGNSIKYDRKYIRLSVYGVDFYRVCVKKADIK